jgi:hypothetical protein
MDRAEKGSICRRCNEKFGDYYNFFSAASKEFQESSNQVIIECPGITIYDETNTRVVQGVRWLDQRDFSKGYEIVGKQIFAPNHSRVRIVPKESDRNICRCAACQDFTVRMRIYNHQKGRPVYQQNSPLMPKDGAKLQPPAL